MHSLRFAEIVLRWLVTSTWPASMAVRLDEVISRGMFSIVASPSPSLSRLMDDLLRGGEIGTFRLKRTGRGSFSGILFLGSSFGLVSGLQARFMIGAPGRCCVPMSVTRELQP